MGEWTLPTLFQVLSQEDQIPETAGLDLSAAQRRVRAERQWTGAIAALTEILQKLGILPGCVGGVVLSGPTPVLSQPELLKQFKAWAFTTDQSVMSLQLPSQLSSALDSIWQSANANQTLPLFPQDPLASEQFCVVVTEKFGLVLLLSEDEQGNARFTYSFVPEAIDRVWQLLRLRVVMMRPQLSEQLDELIDQFPTSPPDYRLVTQFNQLLLDNLPASTDAPVVAQPLSTKDLAAAVNQVLQREESPLPCEAAMPEESSLDVDLLQAIAHEIRTPLTTIRMLTRLLMKRKDMAADALKRLKAIDHECSEQIDRFGFIFRAVELETSASKGMALTAICLEQMFKQSIPRWQQQANQRGLHLDIVLPPQMPAVVTDSALLDQALSSLIDRAARSLPSGSTIQVEAAIAGHQLKLQVQSNLADTTQTHKPLIKSLGQMLMFQPETGNLSLNLAVTKNLFQAMGGKMTVRQRSEQDEVFTIFLPIEASKLRQ
ncbi:HAMP domain-containing histidine kinase [filamentous cyanobacterium LEGE 11480]|uniref:histidine kinase n=1 Tax=Romeriopsis navalis LEGE 11480 TaxID=2777977 RepID=A0A928VQX0_9CYAN|nr:HAMP domain-containing sensor histidine kinase [Romeriopsis navalis]MBE9030940.1 HAMP domain-containing histidine kinase [Romeriopsis navalis LEGE 11480]